MKIADMRHQIDTASLGRELYKLVAEWYPICRSISGNGLREQLRRIADIIPLEMHEVATGTPVFDWTVPREWNIRDAYIKDMAGRRVVDFHSHNLHVLGYSVPVHEKMRLAELREHCFTLPEKPDWIPYRTSYYKENWGFCLTQRQLDSLADGEYEVSIDSTLEDGAMTYGECVLPGEIDDEVLISAHACHPSLANDNLSGIAVAALLARTIRQTEHRYTYRFLFAPGTIGAIAWLALNESKTQRLSAGLVLACLGDSGESTYKKSRAGAAGIDRAAAHVLSHSQQPFSILDFTPYGYDERQYGSPGFDLPVGCLMRTPPGKYAQYHTSADNLDLVQPESLADSFMKSLRILEIHEGNRSYLNLNPKCEPQLGRRGLYATIGGQTDAKLAEMALLWVLNYSDGAHSLLDIAESAQYPFEYVRQAADRLLEAGLLEETAS